MAALSGSDSDLNDLVNELDDMSVTARLNDSIVLNELNFVVLDFETTGLSYASSRVIEVGLHKIDTGLELSADSFQSFVCPMPGFVVPAEITRITSITTQDLVGAPPFHDTSVWGRIAPFFNGPNTVFVAHKASFDWNFLEKECRIAGIPIPSCPRLCTLLLSRRLLHGVSNHKLRTLATHYAIPAGHAHRAGDDARTTATLLLRLLADAQQYANINTWGELQSLMKRSPKQCKLQGLGIVSKVSSSSDEEEKDIMFAPEPPVTSDASSASAVQASPSAASAQETVKRTSMSSCVMM